jgi:hypothetical protein
VCTFCFDLTLYFDSTYRSCPTKGSCTCHMERARTARQARGNAKGGGGKGKGADEREEECCICMCDFTGEVLVCCKCFDFV